MSRPGCAADRAGLWRELAQVHSAGPTVSMRSAGSGAAASMSARGSSVAKPSACSMPPATRSS
jgi:hypothetical protein